eukprot:3062965-Pyramimonas_sp.AAC.1
MGSPTSFGSGATDPKLAPCQPPSAMKSGRTPDHQQTAALHMRASTYHTLCWPTLRGGLREPPLRNGMA